MEFQVVRQKLLTVRKKTMRKTIKLLEQGFETSSVLTPEFAEFYKTFKSEFTKELKAR